jgi:YHS domain-containing protein
MFRPTVRGIGRFQPLFVASLALACLPAAVAAESPWHADLSAACNAAAGSRRPVLAVFVASWSEESRRIAALVRDSAEANALLATCFEPVVVDVDADPEFTRRLGIVHVPAAVVLDQGRKKLTAFECPDAPPAFIAAAARAAREVATTPASDAAALSLATSAFDPAARERGSISMVTAKVRHLSSFADDSITAADRATIRPLGGQESLAGPPVALPEPSLPRAPSAWTAERPTAPLALAPSAAAQPRPAIEPVAQAGATQEQPIASTPPWLAAAAPESSASVTDLPGPKPPATDRAAASPQSDFWATIRRPFTGGGNKPAASVATNPAARPEPPPTMPPARPQWPGLAAAPTSPTAPTSNAAAEQPMPLGLEGYCPVTLAEKQVWAEGRPQYGARHRGRTYLFAGPDQQRAFLADPDRYAPALSGDDPVLAFEQGKSLPGQRRFGVACQSRIYLFASPQTRDAFAANPEKYTGRVALAEQSATTSTRTY